MSATKELAEKLGVVSHYTIPQSSSTTLDYAFVLDFESTCWDKGSDVDYSPEIIEFPVVFIRLCDGKIISEFHEFTKPSEHPNLSYFCRNFTGITQETVNGAKTLSRCLQRFKAWVMQQIFKHNLKMVSFTTHTQSNFGLIYNDFGRSLDDVRIKCDRKCSATFITWTDWDVSTCLVNECNRKGIVIPIFLRSRIDLKVAFTGFYSCRPRGLSMSMKRVGIEFDGREHSGITDARNTAKLVVKMLRDGCNLFEYSEK